MGYLITFLYTQKFYILCTYTYVDVNLTVRYQENKNMYAFFLFPLPPPPKKIVVRILTIIKMIERKEKKKIGKPHITRK